MSLIQINRARTNMLHFFSVEIPSDSHSISVGSKAVIPESPPNCIRQEPQSATIFSAPVFLMSETARLPNWTAVDSLLTIYGEARGELNVGRIAVGSVILERIDLQGWMGKTIQQVCLMPYQFSCYLPDDPNFHWLK